MKESEAKSSPSESCGITSALFTDFYELTMAQGYWKEKMNRPVVFDMFFRRQPWAGGFSVLAGNETLISRHSDSERPISPISPNKRYSIKVFSII